MTNESTDRLRKKLMNHLKLSLNQFSICPTMAPRIWSTTHYLYHASLPRPKSYWCLMERLKKPACCSNQIWIKLERNSWFKRLATIVGIAFLHTNRK